MLNFCGPKNFGLFSDFSYNSKTIRPTENVILTKMGEHKTTLGIFAVLTHIIFANWLKYKIGKVSFLLNMCRNEVEVFEKLQKILQFFIRKMKTTHPRNLIRVSFSRIFC